MRKMILMVAAFVVCICSTSAQNVSRNCYRGFVDAGYSVGIGDYDFGRFEINTTHGYQFNPYFFLGAGTGFHFMSSYKTGNMDIPLDIRESTVDIPLFANVRCNFTKKKVAPFVDLKGGTYVTNNGGLYVNVSAGCRFAINKRQAINVSIGYATEKLEFETFDEFIDSSSMDYLRKPSKYDAEAVTLRVGFEF